MKVPVALQIVAALFFYMAVSGIVKFFIQLSHNAIYLPFDVLGIPIAIGLLHFRPGWRTLALVFTWIGLIMSPILLFFSFAAPELYLEIFGIKVINLPIFAFIPLMLCIYSVIVWQYRVLTRPDIRALFGVA